MARGQATHSPSTQGGGSQTSLLPYLITDINLTPIDFDMRDLDMTGISEIDISEQGKPSLYEDSAPVPLTPIQANCNKILDSLL